MSARSVSTWPWRPAELPPPSPPFASLPVPVGDVLPRRAPRDACVVTGDGEAGTRITARDSL
jgi:hypothetical protein